MTVSPLAAEEDDAERCHRRDGFRSGPADSRLHRRLLGAEGWPRLRWLGLRPGDEIVVLAWLHLSPHDELSTHPEDDMSQPLTGVSSTCSPNRPTKSARIVARDGLRIEVDALEAIDGTPVVDVKPAIAPMAC